MKYAIGIIMLVYAAQFNASAFAATDQALFEQAREIADDLKVPFNERKAILPQVLEMRDDLRKRVFKITRIMSRHAPSCKRARRQLMEVNGLVRKLRASDG